MPDQVGSPQARAVRRRRGTTAGNDSYVGPSGEITIDLDRMEVRLHDGETPGGHRVPNASFIGGMISGEIAEHEQDQDAHGHRLPPDPSGEDDERLLVVSGGQFIFRPPYPTLRPYDLLFDLGTPEPSEIFRAPIARQVNVVGQVRISAVVNPTSPATFLFRSRVGGSSTSLGEAVLEGNSFVGSISSWSAPSGGVFEVVCPSNLHGASGITLSVTAAMP
jgi:hypothetical protein